MTRGEEIVRVFLDAKLGEVLGDSASVQILDAARDIDRYEKILRDARGYLSGIDVCDSYRVCGCAKSDIDGHCERCALPKWAHVLADILRRFDGKNDWAEFASALVQQLRMNTPPGVFDDKDAVLEIQRLQAAEALLRVFKEASGPNPNWASKQISESDAFLEQVDKALTPLHKRKDKK